ncbi:MAG: DUF2804 domain-containing protein [Spirochaetes bacterium]|nr:DUF2804 domain-containing protein [Spirochaetota bacterium]
MQHEITAPLDLLGADGRIVEEGWARQPFWQYQRARIRAGWHRIKEWDYWSVLSHGGRFGITLTMSDLGYAGMFALCYLDFERKYFRQVDSLCLLPRGRTGFPAGSDGGRVAFADKKLAIEFSYEAGHRTLAFRAPGLADAEGNVGLEGRIELGQPAFTESMNIATSWAENRRAFYYNRKINCVPASGGFTIGGKAYTFDPAKDFGGLDWGRGRWTYRNRWYWSSGSGRVGGEPFGFNLGYGFSDRSPASENMLLYRGRAHKLDDVAFHLDERDYTRPWRFTGSGGRFEMDFTPLVDRHSLTDLLLIRSVQHQVFGLFTGTAVLDDGTRIELKDFLGFAEDVLNCW